MSEDKWLMRGLAKDDPGRIKSDKELRLYIDEVGLLPLFRNAIAGFSVEEMTYGEDWWSDDPANDPWLWREILARSGRVAYGKFFNRKAGFVSLKWFPIFANYRRDGYDFDSRWEDELASFRAKKIIDEFASEPELFSYDLKRRAGFGKDGSKNFEGVITDLQMQTYIIIRDFRQRRRKLDGAPYGWPIAVYTTPERLLGGDAISAGYSEDPSASQNRIFARIKEEYPWAADSQIKAVMK